MKDKHLIAFTICVLVGLLSLAGCYQPVRPPEIISAPSRLPARLPIQRQIVGRSVQNRPLESIVLGQGYDVTFVLAAIHGNEPAGVPLAERLATYLQEHPELLHGRQVIILPVANPDGVARGTRFNANNVDLNRNFASANRQNTAQYGHTALSEPEARAIHQLIRAFSPDRIVSIHQPLTCIDYDGPAAALASHIAQHCDLPIHRLGAQPGSLGSYAGLTLHIPIITLELPANADHLVQQELWERYGPALVSAVVYPDRATEFRIKN
jgi:protein MpaA